MLTILSIVPKFQERYTFTIETSMCIKIIDDVYRYVRISVRIPVGGLNFDIQVILVQHFLSFPVVVSD